MSGFRHIFGNAAKAATTALMLGVVMFVTAGCSGSGQSAMPSDSGSGKRKQQQITVLAAASLTESFDTLKKRFESKHPATTVRISYGSSSTLATQVKEGAPADVFASANEKTMKMITKKDLTDGKPSTFVTNKLQIAVPKKNPGEISGLSDFADPHKKIALCAKQVPCGTAAAQVFEKAGITPKPDSYERDVKATLRKVEQNEVDAALVYKTDVHAAGNKVRGISFPEASEAVNHYPITVLKDSKHPDRAVAFMDYVQSDAGRKVLQHAGFGKP